MNKDELIKKLEEVSDSRGDRENIADWIIENIFNNEDRKLLNLFIGDVNTNMGNIGIEMNNLSKRNSDICNSMKQLRDSINMNTVRSNIYKEIKEEVMLLKPKYKALKILDKMNKNLFVEYDF